MERSDPLVELKNAELFPGTKALLHVFPVLKVMKAGGAGGKAVALVWDTGEMKAVDSKNLTQLESMASVLPAQNMVLFWVYTSMVQEAVSDLKDWNRWGSEKGSCLPPPRKQRSKS